MADSVGSGAFLQRQARPLRQAGVEVVESLPSHLLNAASRRPDLRNHRKIVAIDGRIAYTGSQNLVDPEHFKVDAGVGQWVDAMVRVVGPAAVTLEHVFTADWNVEADEPHRMEYCPLPPETTPVDGGAAVQVVPSGPGYSSDLIHHVLLELFYSARKELVITTPYFVPDEAMLEALISASYHGVDVRLIVPERNDSWLVARASNAFLDECLHAGVDVRLFRGGLLHTKSITVDSRTCLFGSVNLDMRSLFLNFELSLLVYDGAFSRAVRALQESYSEQSVRAAEVWDRRTLGSRFLDRTVRLVSPLL